MLQGHSDVKNNNAFVSKQGTRTKNIRKQEEKTVIKSEQTKIKINNFVTRAINISVNLEFGLIHSLPTVIILMLFVVF